MIDRPPFQTTILRPSSAGQALPWWPREISRVARPKSGGKTKNEAVGGDGARIFIDCDGAEVARITWSKGLIQESGSETIQGGCGDAGTGSGSTGP